METNPIRRIKTRHLDAFVEIARAGSFRDAAAKLRLTPPAVSKAVADLELILGVRLFDRDKSGARMTKAGEIFAPFAQQSLASLSHGLARIAALDGGALRPLRVGALPSVAANLLPDAVLRFASGSPERPIFVEDGPIGSLIERLRDGSLDLVVGRLAPPEIMQGITFTPLYAEQVVFAAARDHPLAACADPKELAGATLIFPPKEAAIRPLVDRFLIASGATIPERRFESVSDAFGRTMVLGPARAIWLISRGVVAPDVASGRMTALPIDTSLMAGPVGVMARAEEDPSPEARLFRQALSIEARALAGE